MGKRATGKKRKANDGEAIPVESELVEVREEEGSEDDSEDDDEDDE